MFKDQGRYIFSGSALAVSAHLKKPVNDYLTEQTSAVLAPTGGYAVQAREHINFREIIRTGHVSATVIGDSSEHEHVSTLATVTVENLDIMGFIKADAIVSRVAARAPKDGKDGNVMHATKFHFEGSAFYGLKINGKNYEPRLCDPWTDYPNDPSCRDSDDKKAREVWDREGKQLLYKVGVDHGYQLAASAAAERHLFCGVHYPKPGCPFLEFPEFGRIHLGEFDIFRGRATLTMLRVEFGCAADGDATVCSSGANGHIGT